MQSGCALKKNLRTYGKIYKINPENVYLPV